jgi:hypothetical protein
MFTLLEQQIIRTAHHEAGHLVTAVAQGLELRVDGLAVDARGEGLACYCKQPGESDSQREKVIIATFSGYNSELRLCAETGYAGPAEMQIALSCDGREARSIISSLSYLSPSKTAFQIEEELQQRSRDLIAEFWTAISSLASALLAKEWEPIRALPSGGVWSQVDTAKYLDGQTVAAILGSHDIAARVVEVCR